MHETITFVWGHNNTLIAVVPADSITTLKDGTIQPEGFPCTLIGMNTPEGEKSEIVPIPLSYLEPILASSKHSPVTTFISAYTPDPIHDPHILHAVFQSAPIDWYGEGFPSREKVQSRMHGFKLASDEPGCIFQELEQTERLKKRVKETRAMVAVHEENNPSRSQKLGRKPAPDGQSYH